MTDLQELVKRSQRADEPGTDVRGDDLTVTLPVDDLEGPSQSDEDRVAEMLRERGFNPAEWILDRLVVNEWATYTQTKGFLTRLIPEEQRPWFQLIEGLKEVGASRKPRKRLKPSAATPVTFALMGDDQAPHHNRELHEVTCEALSDLQPDGLVYMGDGVDFDSISRHKTKPTVFESSVQEGIDSTYQILKDRVEAAGSIDNHYLPGNHDVRLDLVLVDRLPALFGIKRADVGEDEQSVLAVDHLLRLGELGFEYHRHEMGDYPHGTYRMAESLLASHGWIAKAGAGASATASVQRLNSSLVVGHTHRLAVSHVTRWDPEGSPTVFTVAESGTMADPRGLQYSRYPDWQNGWLWATIWPDGEFSLDVVSYTDGTLRLRDRRWKLTAKGVRTG